MRRDTNLLVFVFAACLATVMPGCGPSAGEKKALSELSMARVAAERDNIGSAMSHLDASIGTKPTFEVYELRSELFWKEGQYGRAGGDVQRVANEWPEDKRLKPLLDEHQQRSEQRAATAFPFADNPEQGRRFLRDSLEFMTYWKKKSPDERDRYIEAAAKHGPARMYVESALRDLIAGASAEDQEARVLASLAKLAPRIAEMDKRNAEREAIYKRQP